jgi:hypothetical protein
MKKVTFKFATNYNQGTPNNGFSEELSHEIFDDDYDFSDWLKDNSISYEESNGTYFVLDDEDNRTGEAYEIVSEDPYGYKADIMKDIATLIKDNFQSYLQLEDSIGVTGVVEEISNDYLELNHFEDNTAKQYYTSYNGDEVVNGLAENNKFLKSDVINMLSTNGYEPVDTRIREIIVNDSFKEIRDMWCDYRDSNK